jgi:methyl-accepting chemotaxis protein
MSTNKRTKSVSTSAANSDLVGKLAAISRVMATIEFDLDGTVVDANENFLAVLGYTKDEIVGHHHRMFVEPAYAESVEYREFWAQLRAGEFVSREFLRIGKGGKKVYIQASYNPILDAAGKPYKVVKFATDVTAQKLANLNSEGQLQAISRAMALIEFDLDGTVRHANDNFLGALGYTREEIVGRHHRMFVEPAYASSSEYSEFWAQLRAGQFISREFLRIGKGGKKVYIQASYNPILDAAGKPVKVVKFATDITAEKVAKEQTDARLQKMLAESLRAKGALDATTNKVMIADSDFNIAYVNPSLDQFLRHHEAAFQKDLPQFRLASLVGGNIDRFHKDPQRIRQLLGRLTASHKVRLTLGGRIIDQFVVPIRDAAGVLQGFSVEWLDQTDEILAQREIEGLLKSAVEGDLTKRIEAARYEGFMRLVSEGMNRLLDSVSDAFGQVKVAVEQIGQAASQLRSTSQMMSSSSVQLNRAAAESSTSLGKTAQMVNANAENAAMANQLVAHTATAATDGQKRMGEMSTAMGAINGSAQQIAKIIKVIDEIAFQTNLLALNAAVEAARAGRHGKGFAVVAQEVRNLAERSAKAAKETEALIEDSVSKVTDGVKIADATRGALNEIIANVAKVVDLAGEIASASGEQSRTIKSVAESMSQVNESAQAGSQQSTEVASAAEEMGRQMEVLRERLSTYRLPAPVKPTHALPTNLSPEIVEQLLAMLQARGAPASGANGSSNGANGHSNGSNGHLLDPKAVLPLDRDERGFGGF